MRVSREEKARSRARIVASAARLVRERGLEGAGVADVMREAGLTHGGFYRHFDDKDALVAAALESAFDDILARLDTPTANAPPANDAALHDAAADGAATHGVAQAAADFRTFYLSKAHVERPGIGCPVAALGAEVARGTAALRTAFGAGVRRMVAALARATPGPAPDAHARATRELAMLVGALVIARASDPVTARDVLAACRTRGVAGAPES